MPSSYERDENVPPAHIKHLRGKSRQPHLNPNGSVEAEVNETGSVTAQDEASYQELIITASIDIGDEEPSAS